MNEESGGFADLQLMVMDHAATFYHEDWKVSRELAEEMFRTIPGLSDKFKLDQITMGNGECFHTAVHQQLRRPDIQNKLSQRNKQLSKNSDMKAFKFTVRRFMLKIKNPVVETMKEDFQIFMEGMSWEEYWSTKNLMRKECWADEVFLRATAWLLQLDIVLHQNVPGSYEKVISGNINDDANTSNGPQLHLGYLLNRHYQSIIPRVNPVLETFDNAGTSQQSTETYLEANVCPVCKKTFKNVLLHIKKAYNCDKKASKQQIEYLQKISNEKDKENRKRRRENEDSEKIKEDNKRRKTAQNQRDPEKNRENKRRSRAALKEKNPEKYKEDNRRWVAAHRLVQNEDQRLRNFLQNSLFGPIFICLSCHQRHFQTNVQNFSADAIKMPLESCIMDMDPLEKMNFGQVFTIKKGENVKIQNQIICKTCLGYLKKSKLPPHSVMNGLRLDATDAAMEKDGMVLTELENSLIATRIIFQKIFLLPKSRWSGMKDKQVNIPISSSKINNTLEMLPRTPNSAGLLGVQLKRKLEYKNNHKHQLINPQKLFLFIDKLKFKGNPYYQDVLTFESYKQTCRDLDKDGFKLVFGDDECDEEEEQHSQLEDKLTDEILLEEYESKDPVKKYQFHYDDSVVLTDKYPEISVAPGENETPRNLLFDDNWDVRAFPALHNYDGSNGKDQDRDVKLTPQRYFIQRITNINARFAKCPTYLYSAVGFLEELQLNRNINLVGTRGKKISSDNGKAKYELQDPYRALEAMPGTPKYWQKVKYEMLAKIDNFGAFQIFYTLSCGDRRWDPNLAAILLEKGYTMRYNVDKVDDKWVQVIEGRTNNGSWKPLENFLQEEIDESHHELIRCNVVTATRYFDHRVKCFLRDIVMCSSSPMSVKYFTYKVEFQARGAGHVHGTLWLDLHHLETLVRRDGKLVKPDNSNLSEVRPLEGIKKAFKSLKNDEVLNKQDIEVLKCFAEEFTTVTTHSSTVGKDVSKIAKEVNLHHHTHTCRKHGDKCRFGFEKLPSPETLIAQPAKGENRQKILAICNDTIFKVREVLSDDVIMEKIMKMFCKEKEKPGKEYEQKRLERIKIVLKEAKVSFEDYMTTLRTTKKGYSVVLARDIDETSINNFNTEWLRAWNANIDIQICLDYHAVVTYITDYYSKCETELVKMIQAVLDKSHATDNKDKMKIVSNVFQRSRQMGEAEAVYKLIPCMVLSNSNVTCQWVSICTPEERSSRYMKAQKHHIDAGIPLVELDGHNGLWYEQQDIWSKYLRRPNVLEDICFAQFAKMYRGSYKKSYDEDDQIEDDDIDIVDKEECSENTKFDFIMTFRIGDRRKKLPEEIPLKNPFPGESYVMQKRRSPLALRFHKIKQDNDSERYLFGEVMLYCPLRKDIDMTEARMLYEESFEGIRKVQRVKSQVMEHLEGIEEARYHLEQLESEIDFSEIAKDLDPQGEHENQDTAELELEESEYEHLNPDDLLLKSAAKSSSGLYKRIEIPNDCDLRESTRKLDFHQREVLSVVLKYAKDIVKSRKLHNKVPTPPLYMMHGGAGAGKSTVIRLTAQWFQRIVQQDGQDVDCPCVIITSFCGTAAANVDGQTLHSSFGFSYDNKHSSLPDKSRDIRKQILKHMKLVIIDEISMVKADMIMQLDLRLQEITEKLGVPFGGVGILVFGDLMQLPPCMGRHVFAEPLNKDFMITHRIDPRWRMFKSILLEKNHRQGNDKTYAELLNRLRVKEHTTADLESLRGRVRSKNHPDILNAGLFITAVRRTCDVINEKYIAKLEGTPLKLKAVHHHPTQPNYKPHINPKDQTVAETGFRNEIILKPGSRIIVIHNLDTVDSLTNGQLGTFIDAVKNKEGKVEILILKLDKPGAGRHNSEQNPHLRKKYPECVFIKRVSIQYCITKRFVEASSKATLIQFPIRLAYAITAHKVQGSSIPYPTKVAMDISSCFTAGQAYVMLSRVQCMDQVFIVDELKETKIMMSNDALEELKRLEEISVNRNPRIWMDEEKDGVLRISSMNCAGLRAHFEDIKADERLLRADILLLQETSLTNDDQNSFEIMSHPVHFHVMDGRGKGISVYMKRRFTEKTWCIKEGFQIAKISLDNLDILNVYRSSTASTIVFCSKLMEFLAPAKKTLIFGDFNVCGQREMKSKIPMFLSSHRFNQIISEATQIQGRQIDHIYVKNEMKKDIIDVERYSSYYTDHDALLLTMKL